MRFWYRNEPVMLPKDWRWHIEPGKDGQHRVRIEPPSGKIMTLEEALGRVEFETTSSRPHLRTPVPTLE